MGFISLKNDFSFKHVMRNEEVRKYFVSDVLGMSLEEIRSVRLANTFFVEAVPPSKTGDSGSFAGSQR